jgi:hypothetical protein
VDWLWGLVARIFANIFKDWRRDEALVDKGRGEQREADLDERERRRRETDDIFREVEGGDVDLRGDA